MARKTSPRVPSPHITRLSALDRAIDLRRVGYGTGPVLEEAQRIDTFLRTGKVSPIEEKK